MKEIGLDMLVPGERGTVRSFSTPAFEVRHRLMEMGLTMGAAIEVIRLAPMGDPIEISVRGYRLSLRRKEASAVMIQKDEAPVLRQGRFRWRHVQR